MESTGVYWLPIFNILEPHLTVIVVNPAHMHQVAGRKTDVNDTEWIADLLRHGLLRASFMPSPEQRAVRELTRFANRVEKVLEDTKCQWAKPSWLHVLNELLALIACVATQSPSSKSVL